ncbi:MAG: T9SS type A sorting domain-containing protein [Candidatus Cloacimonetes bacterium]|nr:T9SS type A sorting domain-containing protein [Candidatus Cloacimonadota bacterium]MCF7813782.1 T9SS type A sorting domain-containing protein [Candidatus Cloacimonadota bacterium]MCF7868346.1 T9SS type A sorting domain-containing protein [Candidatus Cloacimonadota bacterium]MCF7883820.1 T9SS type A sorting domain-containing protein [Candidatus Cloacimonadota bacterium]
MKKSLLLIGLLVFSAVAFATTIYDIQYTTDPGPDGFYPSPMEGETVTVTGIVTGENYNQDNKFFMTDPGGGAWHGIYVYDYQVGPSLGDEVEVTGTVTEYYGLTELGYCTINILSQGNDVPDPIQVSTLDLVVPALAEQYEGCLVSVSDVEVTAEQDDYGQWYIDDGSGECQVDDGFFYLDSVTPPIVITMGMTWDMIIGCVDFSYDEYGLNPRTPDDLIEVLSTHPNSIPNNSEFVGCYPNPFNPQTTAYLNLGEDAHISLSVYNLKGEKVRTLVNENLTAGEHHISWNGKNDNNREVTSGMYFMHAESNNSDFTSVKKVILLK